MTAEIGTISLILAWVLSTLQSISVFFAYVKRHGSSERGFHWWSFLNLTSLPVTFSQFLLLSVSFACLVHAFITHDFSLSYVAQNSNSNLPFWSRVSAVWGGHEGSLLLWVWVLTLWAFMVAILGRSLPKTTLTLVLAVLGLVTSGFLSFLLFTSNPFEHIYPYFPIDGNDLNPLLQDFGLIIHPPMLYMGYVGFSVAFAFAITGLIQGRLDVVWARWTLPWTIVAWAFLGCGIALGSWWAYYELGWGGWWFWDPVENASFMPWLSGTALIHSLAVCEKRSAFKVWTLFLAILTFSLSLLGTFLVRSGVLTSVHAFASDPTRGLFILCLLAMSVGGSLLLFANRAHLINNVGKFKWLSRESFLFANNLILTFALFVVLLATLYPLLATALDLGLISVGPPFFNLFFVPTSFFLLALLVMGMSLRWKSNPAMQAVRQWGLRCLIGFSIAMLWIQLSGFGYNWRVILGLGLALSVVVAMFDDVIDKTKHAKNRWDGIRRLKPSYWSMQTCHLGFAVSVIGITWTGLFSTEKDVLLGVGETWQTQGYEFQFNGTQALDGPNYNSVQGRFEVRSPDGALITLLPEKRHYPVRGDVMTEAAIHPGFSRDLYVSLGEEVSPQKWSVRIYIKPFIRWIWAGALIMAIGAAIAISDSRFHFKKIAS